MVAALTDHFKCFCLRKRCERLVTLWRPYDIRKFDADAILFREIQCKKMDILMFKRCFQGGLGKNQVKYARMTITHVCFIVLILAGSIGPCLNTRPNGPVFKQHPWDPANVLKCMKKTCVIPIVKY